METIGVEVGSTLMFSRGSRRFPPHPLSTRSSLSKTLGLIPSCRVLVKMMYESVPVDEKEERIATASRRSFASLAGITIALAGLVVLAVSLNTTTTNLFVRK